MSNKSKRVPPAASLKRRVRRDIFNLCVAGQQLSNIAYNWKQDTNRPDLDRQMLKECQEKWDAARNKLPRWMHSA